MSTKLEGWRQYSSCLVGKCLQRSDCTAAVQREFLLNTHQTLLIALRLCGTKTISPLCTELYAAKWPLTYIGSPKAVFIMADVSNEDDVKHMVQQVTNK